MNVDGGSAPPSAGSDPFRARTSGRWLAVGAAALFTAIAIPVVLEGSPLADDYWLCLRPIRDGSFWSYFGAMWQDGGIVRPARYLEYAAISRCMDAPFPFLILVPLALKVIVAVLLYRLLEDLSVRSPWPGIAAAAWMLEPLGTEAALWPAALHVQLGLVAALVALRSFRSDHVVWGSGAALVACFSLEQAIFALPLAAWWTGSERSRRRAMVATAAVAAVVLVAYATWPGHNPKNAMAIADRLHGLVAEPSWYVLFPAAGLGLNSGLFGFLWAWPVSIAVVLGMGALAALLAPTLLQVGSDQGSWRRIGIADVVKAAVLVLLVNLPLVLSLPNVGLSARTFTPTWLVLSALGAAAGASVRWERARVLGALAGAFVAFAILSLSFSVWVRLRTIEFDRAAATWIAERTEDGDVVAICDVPRAVVEPAPVGSFHLHSLHSEDSSWIQYHTGRFVHVRRSGARYWGSRCPGLEGADLVVRFPELLRAVTLPRDRGTA